MQKLLLGNIKYNPKITHFILEFPIRQGLLSKVIKKHFWTL